MKPICRRLLGRGRRRLLGVLAAEALNATRGIYQTLLAGKERMAVGADFQADLALVGRTGLERVSARAMDLNWSVRGVNSWL